MSNETIRKLRYRKAHYSKGIPQRLRNRVELYAKKEGVTEFGELTYSYEYVAGLWAEILPISGKEIREQGQAVSALVTHKITLRQGAIKQPQNDMYFKYNNQKYSIMYFMPHYKGNDLVEFYCKLEIEGDYENESIN